MSHRPTIADFQHTPAAAANPVIFPPKSVEGTKTSSKVKEARDGQGNAKRYALGRLKTGVLNKTEQEYQNLLELQKQAGAILWYKFEGMKLRLANNTFYTPDFVVMTATGELELHEVKGFWADDARVKIKVAADMYPLRFVAVKKKGKGWETEEF